MQDRSAVDVVIINWNTGDQLKECLKSFDSLSTNGFSMGSVIIVDNNSSDGSQYDLSSSRASVELVQNDSNQGFGAACNQGAHRGESEFILFLNPDTTLRPDSFEKSIGFLQKPENQSYGICGVQMVDETGHIAKSCTRFPTFRSMLIRMSGLDRIAPSHFQSYFMENWGHDENAPVDHVIGAFYLVRRKVFRELGGFDEDFFVYLEDLDFSYRASLRGHKTYYLTDTQIFHRGGGSSSQVKPQRMAYSLRSRITYVFKHFNTVQAVVIAVATLTLEPALRLSKALLRGSFHEIKETMKGTLLLWRSLFSPFKRD